MGSVSEWWCGISGEPGGVGSVVSGGVGSVVSLVWDQW